VCIVCQPAIGENQVIENSFVPESVLSKLFTEEEFFKRYYPLAKIPGEVFNY